MLESYEAYADYMDVMDMVEEMVGTVTMEALGSTQIAYREHSIDLTPPWRRIRFCEAVKQYSGIEIEPYLDGKPVEDLIIEAKQGGFDLGRAPTFRLFDKLFSLAVEPQLIQPTFVLDYPLDMSPLAKKKPDNPALVERFEGFAGGMELANAYTELNDPIDQRDRFVMQERWRATFGEEETDRADEDFLLALEYGMPPTGGLGVGIDRLVMLLTGQPSIRDAVLFPQMRSVK